MAPVGYGRFFDVDNGINGHEMYTWSHQMITGGWIILTVKSIIPSP